MSAETAAAWPTAGEWKIDPIHSSVVFAVRHHAVSTFRGTFSPITGSLDADSGLLQGEVPVEGLKLIPGMDILHNDLLSERFFDAASHPTFAFRSDALKVAGNSIEMQGELTMRGVTKPVTATGSFEGPALVNAHDGSQTRRLGVDLTTTIDRREFGVMHNNEISKGVLNLGWSVKIDAALELIGAVDGQ